MVLLDHNQAFTLLGQPIYWYGIIIALGAALGAICAWAREGRMGLPKDTTLDLALVVIPLGLVFARAYYVAFEWPQFSDDPMRVFNIRQGGMAIYGGLIGGVIGTLIYAKIKRQPFLRLADLLAPAVVLAQGIGRWGNYTNQEAYGIEVTNKALQWFPMSVFIGVEESWHYATFFYESIWCILIAVAIILIERRGGLKRAGDGLMLYLLLYMAERTVVEGLRTDSLYLMNVRISQLVSIVGAAAVCIAFALRTRRKWMLAAPPAIAALMTIAAAFDIRGWPYLLILSAVMTAMGLMFYRALPNENPYPQ